MGIIIRSTLRRNKTLGHHHRQRTSISKSIEDFTREALLFNYFRGGQIDPLKMIPTHRKVVRISIPIYTVRSYPMRGNAFINAGYGGPDRPLAPDMLTYSRILSGGCKGLFH
jgi:hypothetical protein